jgi:hypothetical protein
MNIIFSAVFFAHCVAGIILQSEVKLAVNRKWPEAKKREMQSHLFPVMKLGFSRSASINSSRLTFSKVSKLRRVVERGVTESASGGSIYTSHQRF